MGMKVQEVRKAQIVGQSPARKARKALLYTLL